jgi:exopolysaccharide biosynthesis polyprenyl glycosylphosphotransferase
MIPRRFFGLIDLFTLYVAFVTAYAVWPQVHRALAPRSLPPLLRPTDGGAPLPPLSELTWVFIVFALSTLFFLGLVEAYRPLLQQSLTHVIASSAFAPAAATGVLTTALFAIRKLDSSRLFIFSFTIAAISALATVRLVFRSYFQVRRQAGFYAKNLVLIGELPAIDWLSSYFHDNVSGAEYKLLGYLAVPRGHSADDVEAMLTGFDVPLLGDVHQLGELLIHKPIHEVVAVQSGAGVDWLPDVIDNCDAMGVLLRIVPAELLFGKTKVLRTLSSFQLLDLPAIVLAPPHFDSDALFFKRAVDIILATLLLVLLSPLLLAVAVAIKITDPKSSIFYRWNVVGRNGVRFTGYKFTTMYADADERRKELLGKNEMMGPVFKIRNDPRVTPAGRLLRKFSLNELPQLWSVLKGDMSLVGPRPAFPHELEGYGFWHKRKLSVRPGITCLWQVRGRNKISNFDDWVKMDLEYIDNWSLWLDFKILVRTAWAVVAGTGS